MKNNMIIINIGGYEWRVIFAPYNKEEKVDGFCHPNELIIIVRDDLEEKPTKVILAHEITHALLDTQGRYYQKSFGQEELCEFVAWNYGLISRIVDDVYETWRGINNYEKEN